MRYKLYFSCLVFYFCLSSSSVISAAEEGKRSAERAQKFVAPINIPEFKGTPNKINQSGALLKAEPLVTVFVNSPILENQSIADSLNSEQVIPNGTDLGASNDLGNDSAKVEIIDLDAPVVGHTIVNSAKQFIYQDATLRGDDNKLVSKTSLSTDLRNSQVDVLRQSALIKKIR